MEENLFMEFIHFGAVVEIRKFYDNDLYNFTKLMIGLGILNKEITYFINSMGLLMEQKEDENGKRIWEKIRIEENLSIEQKIQLLDKWFTDNNFWKLVELNCGNTLGICIEYQYGKGFTFGLKKDYKNYDDSIKVISVKDLINDCNKKDLFNMDYKGTSFRKELDETENQYLIEELDWFCDFYDWELVKFNNGLYNILDRQTEQLVGYFGNEESENGTLRDCVERVFYRMVDYFKDEEEIDNIDYATKRIEEFKEIGLKYKLYDEYDIKNLDNWLKEEKEFLEKN